MKKYGYLLVVIVLLAVMLGVVACQVDNPDDQLSDPTLTINTSLSTTLTVGDDVDFTKYFVITDKDGNAVSVTSEMLDLTKVDLTKAGTFDVVCTYDGLVVTATFVVNAKSEPLPTATITIDSKLPTTLTVGDDVDFTKYFVITDKDGNAVSVTSEMLDLTKVDLTKAGTFDVVCTYDGVSATLTVKVNEKGETPDLTLADIFEKYADINTWSFAVTSNVSYSDGSGYTDEFAYCGKLIGYMHENFEDEDDATIYSDFIFVDDENEHYVYYYDLGGDKYKAVEYTADELAQVSFPELFLDSLIGKSFTAEGDHYIADDPQSVGDEVYGMLDGCTYTKVELYIASDEIAKLVFYSDEVYEGTTYNCVATFELSDHGKISFSADELEVVYGDVDNPTELAGILDAYADETQWNYALDVEIKINGTLSTTAGVSYSGSDAKYVYMYENTIMTDYLKYDEGTDSYAYYSDNGDGTHTKVGDDNLFFIYYMSQMYPLYTFDVSKCLFEQVGDHYEATYPQVTGNELYGELENCVYTAVELYVEGGKISSIVIYSNEVDEDGNSYQATSTFGFSGYGTQIVDISGLTIVEDGGSSLPEEPVENPKELTDVLAKYQDYDSWNFRVELEGIESGSTVFEDTYWYLGRNTKNQYFDTDENICTDYLGYDAKTDSYTYYVDNLDGSYEKYSQDTDEYYEFVSYMYLVDPNLFLYVEFELTDGKYLAKDPVLAGETFIGEMSDDTYSAFAITVADGNITEINAYLVSGCVLKYTFLDYGKVSFELPNNNAGGEQPVEGGSKTTFISAGLGVGAGELEYSSNIGAYDLDETRGLQFMQKNGVVVLTSKTEVSGITGVTLVVQTNADNGFILSVKIGGVALTSGGLQSLTIAKTGYQELQTVTFVSSVELSGVVEVTLTPTQTSKSMYILSIELGKASGGDTPVGPTGEVMEDQVYDSESFDDKRLQDVILEKEEAIGIPSTGNINVLVIPVQISGTQFSDDDLAKLKKAFNGTNEDTGWESVASFYQKSSYGKLNLTFDFTDIFQASRNANYYATYSDEIAGETGSELLLREALTYFDGSIDYTKYDTNGDGCIDAVYIIYSADVDYNDNSFYWAYVTNYPGEEEYDGLWANYYMFAGLDFMDENVEELGLKINTETYIHETGHLFGLDDYYDYATDKGANEGLGGADMMDYNIGDHGVYSKIMLGWMDATIVTSTTTITISASATKGECILIPLSFNNSYFSEYLLIDLYSATDLNEMEANQPTATNYLYDGASYGVRIYHVSNQCDAGYNTEFYYSVTNYNNSYTNPSLIKLVEADGETRFSSSDGIASESDLWHAGDVFSQVFSAYKRNDGKLVNFDITIVSDSSSEATVTITFETSENA